MDPEALDPLIFAPRGSGGDYYRLGAHVGTAWGIGEALKRGS